MFDLDPLGYSVLSDRAFAALLESIDAGGGSAEAGYGYDVDGSHHRLSAEDTVRTLCRRYHDLVAMTDFQKSTLYAIESLLDRVPTTPDTLDAILLLRDECQAMIQRAEPEKRSYAVVATTRSSSIVLWYHGEAIKHEVDAIGVYAPDLGLDDGPEGISIWEGTYVWSPGPYEHPEDGDSTPSGTFREPNEYEWDCIRNGKSPWS